MAPFSSVETEGLTSACAEVEAPFFADMPHRTGVRRRRWHLATALAASATGIFALALWTRRPRGQEVSSPAEEALLELDSVRSPSPVQTDGQPPLKSNASRLLEASCDVRIIRYEKLGKQELHGGSRDDMFPDSMLSIAPPNDPECKNTGCKRFNSWVTLQAAAKGMKRPFSVWSAAGPSFKDIQQGQLGDCYFLSALASLAQKHPQLIQRAFVNKNKWAEGVYTTRWLLNGREALVKVDNKIPGNKWGPFFAQPSEAGAWWTAIMEKSWSKIYGSFKMVENGEWQKVIQSLTMAPTVSRFSYLEADVLFNYLQEATQKNWPTAAWAFDKAGKYGLQSFHIYLLVGTRNDATYGPVVRMFNPWNSDGYNGAMPNTDKEDGVFDMKLAEFHDAFHASYIAMVEADYKYSLQQLQSPMTAWEVKITGDEPFYVTLGWPGWRILDPCKDYGEDYQRSAMVIVRKRGSHETFRQSIGYSIDSFSVAVTAGAGDYVILLGLSFNEKDTVRQSYLSVYSKEATSIKKSPGDVMDAAAKVCGPADEQGRACPVISIKNEGLFKLRKDKVVHGIPTYWRHDGKVFVYFKGPDWMMWKSDSWEKAEKGFYIGNPISLADMSCGCKDSEKVGWLGVSCSKENVAPGSSGGYSDYKCQGTGNSPMVQTYCPVICGLPECKATPAPTSAPTMPPMPTLPPVPTLPPLTPTQPPKQCVDRDPSGVRLEGKLKSCSELGHMCAEIGFVQEACCATCAAVAAAGGEPFSKCEDQAKLVPPLFDDGLGEVLEDCSKADDYWCRSHRFSARVRQQCCATCDAAQDQCVDRKLPEALKDGKGGILPTCGQADAAWCESKELGQLVRSACCATCTEVAKRAVGDYGQCANHDIAPIPAQGLGTLLHCAMADKKWCSDENVGQIVREECCASCEAVAKASLPDYAQCEDQLLPYAFTDPSLGILRQCQDVKKEWCDSELVGPLVRRECCESCHMAEKDDSFTQCEDKELDYPIPDYDNLSGPQLEACWQVNKYWCEAELAGSTLRSDVCCASCRVVAKATLPDYQQCKDHKLPQPIKDHKLGELRSCTEPDEKMRSWCSQRWGTGPRVRQACCQTCNRFAN